MIAYELEATFLVPTYDLFGNLVCLTDPKTEQIVEAYSYSAYGNQTIYDSKGGAVDSSQLANPWGYQGKRKDPETDFIYFGYRY